ncbi:MAG: Hpt domain-containing protein [Gammaproteobacteria bacterium]|nr:Hpt domain-containing protein [Gammaproteobacteria bacterium]
MVDGAGNRREIIAIAQSALTSLLQSISKSKDVQPTNLSTSPLESQLSESEKVEALETGYSASLTAQETPDEKLKQDVESSHEAHVPASEKPPLEDIDAEILEIFVEEAREELETIRHDLPAWLKNRNDKDSLISFRRSFHTLKGSGRLVGAKILGELAWSIENMLNKVIDETIQPTPEMSELLEQVLQTLPVLIDCQEKNVYPDDVDVEGVMLRAFALAEGRSLDEMPSTATQGDESSKTGGSHVDQEIQESVSDLSGLSLESDLQDEAGLVSQAGFSDSDLMIEVDTELLDVFAEESRNHLAELEDYIASARSSEPRPQISDDIIRAFHTMHGSARMTGITPIANLSKSVEEYLKILAAKNMLADDGVLGLLEGSIIAVQKFLSWLPEDDAPEPDADSYLSRLANAKDDLIGDGQIEKQYLPGERETEEVETSLSIRLIEGAAEYTGDKSVDIPSQLQDEKIFTLDEDQELVDIFQEEANELLEGIAIGYDEWQKEKDNSNQLETIQRGLHTLKGSARLAGIMPVGDLAYALEKIFSTTDILTERATESLISMLKQSLDTLAAQIREIEVSGTVHWADAQISALEACFDEVQVESAAVEPDSAEEEVAEISGTAAGFDDELGDLVEEDLSEYYAEPVSFLTEDEYFVVGEDPELLEVFYEESNDLIKGLEEYYAGLEQDSAQAIPEIQRILHTLKGSARLAGVLPVGDLSHALEDYFKELSDTQEEITEAGLETIRRSIDMLATQVDEAESLGRVHKAEELVEQLESLIQSAGSESEAAHPSAPNEETEFDESISENLGYREEANSELLFEPISYLQEGSFVEVGDDPELLEVFCEEAKEILEHLESGYQAWTESQDDFSLIGDIQRSLHTLKGSARLAGITPVGDLSHAVESFLTWVVNDAGKANDSILSLIRRAVDRLAAQVDDANSIGRVALADDLVDELDDYAASGLDATAAGPEDKQTRKQGDEPKKQKSKVELDSESAVVLPFISEIAKRVERPKEKDAKTPFKATKDQVRISTDLMDRLVNNAGEVSIYRARLEQQNSVLGFNLAELEQTVSRLYTQLRNLEIETEAQILYRWERDTEKDDREKAEFDPLELDRFSNMQQLSRALVETVNDLGSINEALTELQRETDTLLLQQSRISTDLQDGLLRTRMVPFSQLIPRMQRLVRQTADQTSKKAQLESFGAEGELERNILNRMVPVLEHLLRNAVSHGIETPADRQTVGKDETGKISLYIDREGTNVLLTLSDDGRGLDIEAIRAQAIKQGMINQTANVSDDDLIQCVLNPGFSTAKEVTQIAGRGVGLDVVASEVKQLGGGLEIDSQPGRGTSFNIRLPLTLAISDALLVRVGEEVYAIPHGSVEGVVRISNQELQACYSGDQEHYTYANRNYKPAYLGRMMGLDGHDLPDSVRWFPLLLVHAGEHHVALQVDDLLGTRQIVVKSIGKQAGSVRWITGGTILADGQVALILDIAALVRMDAARLPSSTPEQAAVRQPVKERIRVMVVDDSITVRKVTGRLLERHEMDVVTAKDGVEAVALLQEQVPDIMLLDIEMPRMDGFELARHINNSVDYYGLPIIMITSRVGEKHRQRAFDLGVKRCLGKPYQEAELLENINEVLMEAKS